MVEPSERQRPLRTVSVTRQPPIGTNMGKQWEQTVRILIASETQEPPILIYMGVLLAHRQPRQISLATVLRPIAISMVKREVPLRPQLTSSEIRIPNNVATI